MKILKSLAVLLLIVITSGIRAQTADEIVEKYIKAVGGRDKIKAVKTLKMTGKVNAMGFEIPITIFAKRPNSMRTESSIQGMTMIQAYNAKTKSGWMVNPMGGDKAAQKMNPEQTASMEENEEMIGGPLMNYKEKGATLEFIGKEDLEGTETLKLMLTKKNKNVIYYFIDAGSFMILKETAKYKYQDKEIEGETFYSNYKTVDGITLAGTHEQKSGGQLQALTSFDKIEFNVPMEDSLFEFPVETKDPKATEKKEAGK